MVGTYIMSGSQSVFETLAGLIGWLSFLDKNTQRLCQVEGIPSLDPRQGREGGVGGNVPGAADFSQRTPLP